MVDYLGDALKRYSEMGLTPRDITRMINKLLKKLQNPEVDVLFAMRTPRIKPAKGRKRFKTAGKQRKMQGNVKNARE